MSIGYFLIFRVYFYHFRCSRYNLKFLACSKVVFSNFGGSIFYDHVGHFGCFEGLKGALVNLDVGMVLWSFDIPSNLGYLVRFSGILIIFFRSMLIFEILECFSQFCVCGGRLIILVIWGTFLFILEVSWKFCLFRMFSWYFTIDILGFFYILKIQYWNFTLV